MMHAVLWGVSRVRAEDDDGSLEAVCLFCLLGIALTVALSRLAGGG